MIERRLKSKRPVTSSWDTPLTQSLDRATELISQADAILVSAGAGMGVDSGLPDFRGRQGFWHAYPVARKLGLSFIDLANPSYFEDNPRLAWAFYGHRLELYRDSQPHRGYTRLLQCCESKSAGYFVFTSNVDGHFYKAGFEAERLVECHGSIHRLQCTCCSSAPPWSAEGMQIVVDMNDFRATGELPACPHCGSMARPNILMFGDYGWDAGITERQQAGLQRWWEGITANNRNLAIIELGAGKSVPTVRRFSEQISRYPRATLIRINPRDDEVPPGQVSIALPAAEALDAILP